MPRGTQSARVLAAFQHALGACACQDSQRASHRQDRSLSTFNHDPALVMCPPLCICACVLCMFVHVCLAGSVAACVPVCIMWYVSVCVCARARARACVHVRVCMDQADVTNEKLCDAPMPHGAQRCADGGKAMR
eukprot:3934094-Rhodomonas_salina.11